MKKILSYMMIVCILLSTTVTSVYASDFKPTYVGSVTHSPIIAYINNYPIPSYIMNGYTFVQVEDLASYGFDIKWNEYNKTLRIIRNDNNEIKYVPAFIPRDSEMGKKNFDFYTTAVKTYIGNYGYEIECLAGKPGCTYINIENLAVFGELQWVPELNHMKLWIRDGLECGDTPCYVPKSLEGVYGYEHSQVSGKNAKNYYEFSHLVGTEQINFWYGEFGQKNGETVGVIYCPLARIYADVYDSEGRKVYNTSRQYYRLDQMTMAPYIAGFMDAPLSYEIVVPVDKLTSGNDYMARITFWCSTCDQGETEDIYFSLK